MEISRLTGPAVEPPAASRAAPAPRPELRTASGAQAFTPMPGNVGELGSKEHVQAAIDGLIARLDKNVRTGSRIRVDDATDRFVVQILNADNEVIRQIPPEDVLRVLARFRQITGILFDQRI